MTAHTFFRNLLVPVDGSTSCLRAKQLAAQIAQKFQSRVTVVHVVSHDFMHPELKAHHQLPSLVLHELDKEYLKAGRKIIRHAEELFMDEGIAVESELIKAEDPADTILKIAKERNCDLVIIGNRSKTQSERFALGSVTEKVAMYASCPVLIAKGKTELRQLLVAVDGSKQANKALEYALQLAANFKAKITLLHVEETRLYTLTPDLATKVGLEILTEAEKKIKSVNYEKKLKPGNPSEIILKMAWLGDFDLVVLGNRGLSSIERFLLGSVSADVSMHAKRSILIVR